MSINYPKLPIVIEEQERHYTVMGVVNLGLAGDYFAAVVVIFLIGTYGAIGFSMSPVKMAIRKPTPFVTHNVLLICRAA